MEPRSDLASDRRRRRHQRRLDGSADPVSQRRAGARAIERRRFAKLREYVNRGGFIFADAVCEGQEFDRGFRSLIDRMFPEPEHRLHLLPPEHAVWSAEEPVDPRYRAAAVGRRRRLPHQRDLLPRESVVLLGASAAGPRNWCARRNFPAEIQGRMAAARAIGVNVLAYATNREPKYKLDLPQLADRGAGRFDRPRQAVRGHGQALGRMERGADGAAESAAIPVGRGGPARQHRRPRSSA